MFKQKLLYLCFVIMNMSGIGYASIETPLAIDNKPTSDIYVDHAKKIAKTIYSGLITGKDYVISAAKKHPFLTMAVAIILLSKKTRRALWTLPQGLWQDIQEYPIAMALLGGFLLNYIIA